MKRLLILLSFAGGCANYTAAKIELVDQVRRGVNVTRHATAERQQLIERLNDVQFQRLDDAFDTDVKQRPTLDATWVIEHRKAYAIGRDALSNQRHSLRLGQETIESNLDLIDRALVQLQLMHQAELKLSLPEVMK